MPPTQRVSQPVSELLLAWQATGDERAFEQLFAAIAPLVERVARQMLRSADIADPGAIDDVTSRVFDHLRRLPGPHGGERGVERFRPVASCDQAAGQISDGGIAFVRWLTRERARDIARARRRQARHAKVFSQLDAVDAGVVWRLPDDDQFDGDPGIDEVRLAITMLDDRARRVIELLLAGENQSSIAKLMDVCEGTVSRIRARAIERIQAQLRVPGAGG
jgi:RNA polymerase sigma factor (sigma-70 family)